MRQISVIDAEKFLDALYNVGKESDLLETRWDANLMLVFAKWKDGSITRTEIQDIKPYMQKGRQEGITFYVGNDAFVHLFPDNIENNDLSENEDFRI